MTTLTNSKRVITMPTPCVLFVINLQKFDTRWFFLELAHTQEAEMPWQLSERQCKLTMEENEIYTEAGGQKVPKLRKASKVKFYGPILKEILDQRFISKTQYN